MNLLSRRTRVFIGRAFISALIVPFTAWYPLTFLWWNDAFIVAAALSVFLLLLTLSWYRWMWCIYAFVACIPLLNTIKTILGLPEPGINVNLLFLAALMTSWAWHLLWHIPLSSRRPRIYALHTPMDIILAIAGLMIVLTLPIGWLRFNNIACPGFYLEMPRQFASIPFLSLLDNYLCFTRAWMLLQLGIAFYIVASSIREWHELRNTLWICAATGCAVCLYGIFYQRQFGVNWVGSNFYFGRINATLNGPHAAGIYFVTLSALCFTLFIATDSLARKIALFVAFILSLAGMWFTGTRAALLALFIIIAMLGGMFWIVSMLKSVRIRAMSIVALALLLFLGPGSLLFQDRSTLAVLQRIPQYQRLVGELLPRSLSRNDVNAWLAYRFFHYNAAATVIEQHPFIGAGIGSFDKMYRSARQADDTRITAYTHSLFLDVYAEMGIVALATLVALYCVIPVLCWKLYRSREVSWRWKTMAAGILIAFGVGFIANFSTSDLFYVFELQLWFTILLVLLVRNYQMHFSPEPVSLARYWHQTARSSLAFVRASSARTVVAAALVLLAFAAWSSALVSSALAGYRFFHSAQPYTFIDRILEYGVFYYEKDAQSNQFARTASVVYKPIGVRDRYLRLSLRADHPDARELPVQIAVRLDNILLGSAILSNRQWSVCLFDLNEWKDACAPTNSFSPLSPIPAVLNIKSSRTWNPFRDRRGNTNRDFGADLGAIEWGYY